MRESASPTFRWLMQLYRGLHPWEVFNPMDGVPLRVFSFKWMAKIDADLRRLDYAKRGEGWLQLGDS